MATSEMKSGKAERPGAWRGAPAIFAHMFRPPPRFAPALEAEFVDETVARWTTARNAAVVLVALVWVSYFGWDYYHGYRNQDFRPALDAILPLRVAGTLCIAAAALTLFLRGRSYFWVIGALSACLTALYLLSLAMIAVAPFPYNYLFYYICLPVILTFMFGLFRLPSRLVYALTLLCLVASFAFLLFTQTTDFQSPKSLMEFMSKSLSYYNLAAVIYLFSFSLVGCAVAVELERTARDAFTRERQLTDRNARLETAQRETRAKTSALVKAKDALRALAEQQNVAKSKFLADAAHDLRQPMQALTNLLGAARHALDRGDAARADEILKLAQDASRLTRTSFNAVLDISRLESGFVAAEIGDFDLAALVEEVAASCRAAAEERGVELRLRWRRDRPIAVRSDRHLLGRVIGNLLTNAVKHSDPAKADGAAVILGIVRLPSRVRIDIVDNGVGIDEADWARVFRPFVQLHNDERDREKGVGLGLSIVSAIIPLLGEHRLDMRSTAGKGTRFSLELPYGEAALETLSLAELTRPPGPVDLSGLYILYVEDDALVRNSALALFDTLGLRYEAYGSVAEMEAALPSLERIPDLLITDYRLPDGRTAQDVVRLATAAFETALPLIVVTGEMQPLDEGDWLGAGRVLRKPVSPDALAAEISSLCLAALGA
ncbi:MAG: two-component system, sensor histidine kinase [Sphingomonadales bacterium]|jgi:signal transduction histidine kinase|nr:two-component system, sensor histidine kinase [Sphingomonadales bacterium]MEA3045575.1 two-component system, sensor histidine kinase [Sphingomonadales bacterium]